MASRHLDVLDFHNHYVSPEFPLTAARNASPDQTKLWNKIGGKVASKDALLRAIDEGDVNGRVINTPPALIGDADGNIPDGWDRRINDGLAEIVSRHPGKLHGLATVDAFGGEAAGKEVWRAIKTLGLKGIFVESAKGELLLDAPRARPTLAAAAALGVPVFVHPINSKALTRQLAPFGRIGTSLARGTINSASLYALLGGGVFDELPNLHVVVTTLAIGGVLLAAASDDGAFIRKDTPASLHRHVYIDTMGLHPTLIRAAVDLLGADHVILGTDWPIYDEGDIRGRFGKAADTAGLSEEERQLLAGGNARRLLGLTA